jgi:hypothetical protein
MGSAAEDENWSDLSCDEDGQKKPHSVGGKPHDIAKETVAALSSGISVRDILQNVSEDADHIDFSLCEFWTNPIKKATAAHRQMLGEPSRPMRMFSACSGLFSAGMAAKVLILVVVLIRIERVHISFSLSLYFCSVWC